MLKDSRGVLCGTMATWDGYVDFQPVLAWHPSSDEEITTCEPVTNTEEMGHMQERISEMEGVLQQILSHLNQPGTRPPMA